MTVGPQDSSRIPRYAGLATFARLPRLEDVGRADVAVVGVPFDSGVSYRPGARFGPAHVREASRLLRPTTRRWTSRRSRALQVADAGDIAVNPFNIDEAVREIEARADELTADGARLVTIGGDHTIALPLLRARRARARARRACVHFDAHLDTWDTYFGAAVHARHAVPARRRGGPDRPRPQPARRHPRARSTAGSDLDDDAALGFHRHPAARRRAATASRRRSSGCRARVGDAPGVRLGRHRRARPGARARHRHARGRRPDQPRAARRCCAA